MPIMQTVIQGGGSAPVIDTLNVTPTTSAQQITAPQGTDGYSPVNVSAVTSAIDANIQAGNIKNGVTILGTTGTYTGGAVAEPKIVLYTVTENNKTVLKKGNQVDVNGAEDIGDYALKYACQYGNNTTTVQSALVGTQNLTEITGYQALYYAFDNALMVNSTGLNNVRSITGYTALYYAFRNSSVVTADLESLETMEVKSSNGSGSSVYSPFQYTFDQCTNLVSADLRSFKYFVYNEGASATYTYGFYYTFRNCTALIDVNLSSIEALIGGDFYYAFQGCTNLTTITYNSTKVAAMMYNVPRSAFYDAFRACSSLTTPYFIKEAPSVMYVKSSSFYDMFRDCTSLLTTGLNNVTKIIGDANTRSVFANAYLNCESLTSTGTNNLVYIEADTSTSNTAGFFGGTFGGCTALTDAGMGNLFKIVSYRGLYLTFNSCTALISVSFDNLAYLGGSGCFVQTFQNCTALTTLSFPNLKAYGSDSDYSNMLSGCTGVTVHFPSDLQSEMSSWSSVTGGFGGTNTTVLFDLPANVRFIGKIGPGQYDNKIFYRHPALDTANSYGWSSAYLDADCWATSTSLSLNDPIYSDSACTTQLGTIIDIY